MGKPAIINISNYEIF